MEVGAADVINSLFDPGDIVNLRVFADRKPSTFTGEKLSVEAGKFSGIMDTLKKHNAAGRGHAGNGGPAQGRKPPQPMLAVY